MKKIALILATFALLTACNKSTPATPAPTKTAPTGTTTPKWHYEFNYKKPGDATVYSGSGCYSEQEILNGQTLYGWYNIQKFYSC